MAKGRKGMSAALTLVIAAVVLMVVSLVVITIVSGGLGNFFKRTDMQSNQSSTAMQCATAVSYCNLQISSACSTSGSFIGDSLQYSSRPCTGGTDSWSDSCGGVQTSC